MTKTKNNNQNVTKYPNKATTTNVQKLETPVHQHRNKTQNKITTTITKEAHAF